jgi:hypothetical protein
MYIIGAPNMSFESRRSTPSELLNMTSLLAADLPAFGGCMFHKMQQLQLSQKGG